MNRDVDGSALPRGKWRATSVVASAGSKRPAATDKGEGTAAITRGAVPGPALVALVDDIASRTNTARISMRLLFEATSAELTSYLSHLVEGDLVDEVLVRTYAQVWRLAGERPHAVPAENWLTAVALVSIRDAGGRLHDDTPRSLPCKRR